MIIKSRVKPDTYFDSITLMKIARILTERTGVDDAAAIMATEPNLQLLAEAGLTPPENKAGPADILLVVRAIDEVSAEAALQAAEEQLTSRPVGNSVSDGSIIPQPRSLEQAVSEHPEHQLAIISVPGSYAALEAEIALRSGLHVFLFSDNVSLEDEIALKQLARSRNLLLMGPDCGTAQWNGVGLGFINVVPSGKIGIVGASGTGIQQVMSLIAQQGGSVSQVVGCGGRDLSEAVGAVTTLQGLQLLQADPQTEIIVIISKPPAPTVAERVLEAALKGSKPVIVIFVGADHHTLQERYGQRLVIAHTLAEAAQRAMEISREKVVPVTNPSGEGTGERGTRATARVAPTILPVEGGKRLSALFSGGTLCDEAMHIWSESLGLIYSNIPLKLEWRLVEGQAVQGHTAIDFGADEYTRGRPHPMIDPSLRLKRLQEDLADPQIQVVLLDMVLGYCSHPDPAAIYGPVIQAALEQAKQAGRQLSCIISLCGTEGDPQKLSHQASQFTMAGAEVFTSNAAAARRCIELLA